MTTKTSHYMTRCSTHGTVYGQCRCPDPSKAVYLVPCNPDLCPKPETTHTGTPDPEACGWCQSAPAVSDKTSCTCVTPCGFWSKLHVCQAKPHLPAATTSDHLRDEVERLRAELSRTQGMLQAAQREARTHKAAAAELASEAATARTDGYAGALRWVIADLEANRACSAYKFIRDFRVRLSAIENRVERP